MSLLALSWAPAARARSPSCEQVERIVLANGLEVVLAAEPSAPSFAVVSSVRAGMRDDPPGYEGLARYVGELSTREASPHAASGKLYRQAGAVAVDVTTGPDLTQYQALVPTEQLERAIWVEARRLALALDALDEGAARDEREVLQRTNTVLFQKGPNLSFERAIDEALFPAEHPYHSLLPSDDSISRLTLAGARWFFFEHYSPDRVRLVLLGTFDVGQAKALVARYLGALPAAPEGKRAAAQSQRERECALRGAARVTSPQRLILTSRVHSEYLELYWPTEPGEEPERWRGVFDILVGVLLDAAEPAGISHDIYARLENNELGGHWKLHIGILHGQDFERAESLVRQALAELRHNVPNRALLTAKQQSLELAERLAQGNLLRRARQLAARECAPTTCISIAEQLGEAAFRELSRFSLERALVVERRHDGRAIFEGEIERRP